MEKCRIIIQHYPLFEIIIIIDILRYIIYIILPFWGTLPNLKFVLITLLYHFFCNCFQCQDNPIYWCVTTIMPKTGTIINTRKQPTDEMGIFIPYTTVNFSEFYSINGSNFFITNFLGWNRKTIGHLIFNLFRKILYFLMGYSENSFNCKSFTEHKTCFALFIQN